MQPIPDLCLDERPRSASQVFRSMTKRIYLAGPEVFLANAQARYL